MLSMFMTRELADDLMRSRLELAEQVRRSRGLRRLARAQRRERRAERRMLAAWRRAEKLRDALESGG